MIIELTLDVTIVWFGSQKAVCVNKQHEVKLLGVVNFKSVQLLMFNAQALDLFTKTKDETIFNFVYPLSIMLSGTQIYSTLFLAKIHKAYC